MNSRSGDVDHRRMQGSPRIRTRWRVVKFLSRSRRAPRRFSLLTPCWREIIVPRLDQIGLWPFDGSLAELASSSQSSSPRPIPETCTVRSTAQGWLEPAASGRPDPHGTEPIGLACSTAKQADQLGVSHAFGGQCHNAIFRMDIKRILRWQPAWAGREFEGWGFGAPSVLARAARCGAGQAHGRRRRRGSSKQRTPDRSTGRPWWNNRVCCLCL